MVPFITIQRGASIVSITDGILSSSFSDNHVNSTAINLAT